MSSVQVRNVSKNYAQTNVIKDVSVDIPDGEFVVLVGPSGCGKSTLLRMIAGLEDISAGQIAIGGNVINDVAPKSRDIAMVFQNYALYPHMTVRENMEFALQLKKVSKAEIDQKVIRAADILGLRELLSRYPRQLSGGQRQRVAMGRAIVRDPKVFLFDEPLSNLDAKLRVQMRAEIKALHQRLKTTTVYVTHDQVEAMTMADRIVVMRSGVVEQVGTPLELYDNPANRFVAQFIGSPAMNILEGEVVENAFRMPDGVRLPLPPAADIEDGRKLHYGIRPEHIALADRGVAGTVHLVEPTGSSTEVMVTVGVQQISVLAHERLPVRPGQHVHLSYDVSKVCLFDEREQRVRI
ncbi:sn-glycerol-3-phosphate ABC transporter ATP-binding protein UgpC [Rhizobium sp. XQZ8]|uniref:ABC transporter ATP-binding protein n=1 Tax=Rhizobium populisoli TaxID=2859785 RepID=UPI001CA58B51|nr:sn-glycerol-3-phosphate ABC transporter ATP-binding protein UgpC [Rhizobium populisoli]MBW6424349.1 sn-glycerol-3-phosphate ABC transporter ATP-binding protein UgpC [Rhizobium populisoli]